MHSKYRIMPPPPPPLHTCFIYQVSTLFLIYKHALRKIGNTCSCAQPLHPPSIFVGNPPYLRGTKFVPQHDMTSFDMFFLDWSKVQRSKLRQLCSFELFVNLRRIHGYEEHALVRAYTSSSTTCPPIGGTHRKNIIEVALCFRFTLRPL